jgi:tRNA(Ile2)-agmatinylcytidine synthase
MAYEPTKNFRQMIRHLVPGDDVRVCGSYKKESVNLEKIQVIALADIKTSRPPVCIACNKRMTSDGKGKGWKCKKCGARADDPEVQEIPRTLKPGWYEVPPTARRHLAKPLCRGSPPC